MNFRKYLMAACVMVAACEGRSVPGVADPDGPDPKSSDYTKDVPTDKSTPVTASTVCLPRAPEFEADKLVLPNLTTRQDCLVASISYQNKIPNQNWTNEGVRNFVFNVNNAGKLESIDEEVSAPGAAKQNRGRYKLDKDGRVIGHDVYWTDDTFGPEPLRTATYNEDGRPTRVDTFYPTNPNMDPKLSAYKSRVDLTWDGDRLLTRRHSGVTLSGGEPYHYDYRWTWTYDAAGRLTAASYQGNHLENQTIIDVSERTTWSYDAHHRPIKVSRYSNNELVYELTWLWQQPLSADKSSSTKIIQRTVTRYRPFEFTMRTQLENWQINSADPYGSTALATGSSTDCVMPPLSPSDGYPEAIYRVGWISTPQLGPADKVITTHLSHVTQDLSNMDRHSYSYQQPPWGQLAGHNGLGGDWLGIASSRSLNYGGQYQTIDKRQTEVGYDATGRMISEVARYTLKSGVTIAHLRQRKFAADKLVSDRVTYAADEKGQSTSVGLVFDYDALGAKRKHDIDTKIDGVAQWTWDANQRPLTYRECHSCTELTEQNAVLKLDSQYDHAGRITRNEATWAAYRAEPSHPVYTSTYTYDDQGRLIQFNGSSASQIDYLPSVALKITYDTHGRHIQTEKTTTGYNGVPKSVMQSLETISYRCE